MEDVILKNNFQVLLAQKAQREARIIHFLEVHRKTGISRYTLELIASDKIRDYPKKTVAALCVYLECQPGDFFYLERQEKQNE